MYVVLIETSANQKFIFATNKLRENIGASQLTYRIGTEVVRKAAKEINGSNGTKLKEIIATSGKAIYWTENEDYARKLIKEVTKYAAKEMPGLTVHGAIVNCEKPTDVNSFHQSIKDVHLKLKENRQVVPGNDGRFQRLPFVGPCSSSELPASRLYQHVSLKNSKEKPLPLSASAIRKQEASNEGKERLENALKDVEKDLYFPNNPNNLEKRFEDVSWLAVIHADGNGLGQIFLDFAKHAKASTVEEYIKKMKAFSDALDECTVAAASYALKNMQDAFRKANRSSDRDTLVVPALPIILGGDDLTMICDGRYAVKFTADFLKSFAERTREHEDIVAITGGSDGSESSPIGICAGIAIVKPHFPFHVAYRLSEQLLRSAKRTKSVSPSLCSLDYHVVYDTSIVDLDSIRNKYIVNIARPYVVVNGTNSNSERVENRMFSELQRRVNVIRKGMEEDGTIPNSQLHDLREKMHLGEDESESFANTIRHRYPDFKKLDPLFCEDNEDEFRDTIPGRITHFLDAIEIADLWEGFD
jgi:predicted hydrocarbon binding protein